MGRALFSQKYAPAAPVRTEPEVVSYTTWSRWNPFDPDSNEFFVDAEREVFTDTPEYQRELEELQRHDAANPTVVEPPPFERVNSAPVQPMTPNWQNTPLDWQTDSRSSHSTEWEHLSGTRTITEPDGSERVIPVYISSGYRSPTTTGFTPEPVSNSRHGFRPQDAPPRTIIVESPSSLVATSNTTTVLEDDVALEVEPSSSPSLPSPTFRRTVDIEIPAPPSPDSPASPATPTDQSFNSMFSSSPPSVSLQTHNWNHSPAHMHYPHRSAGGPAPRRHFATTVATRSYPYPMVAGRV